MSPANLNTFMAASSLWSELSLVVLYATLVVRFRLTSMCLDFVSVSNAGEFVLRKRQNLTQPPLKNAKLTMVDLKEKIGQPSPIH